ENRISYLLLLAKKIAYRFPAIGLTDHQTNGQNYVKEGEIISKVRVGNEKLHREQGKKHQRLAYREGQIGQDRHRKQRLRRRQEQLFDLTAIHLHGRNPPRRYSVDDGKHTDEKRPLVNLRRN